MRKTLTILAFLASLPAGAALADEDCFVPMADWQPREAVARFAAEQGWNPRRIRIDDGCYEVDGRDKDGRAIEVKLNPGTLRIVDFEYEDDKGEDDKGKNGQSGDD